MRKVKSTIQRFTAKYIVNQETGCWEWIAGTGSKGYAQFQLSAQDGVKQVSISGHRFSFEFYRGPIPDGLWVLHKCDNRRCVNPEHLFLGTHQDNMDDCVAKGRKKMPNYRRTYSKIHQDQVNEIRGLKGRAVDIAPRYNVNPQTIRDIRQRKTWKHISELE